LHQDKEKTNSPNVLEVQERNSFLYEIDTGKEIEFTKDVVPFHSIQYKWQVVHI